MEMKPIAYLHPYGVKGLKHARDTGITQWATMCHPTAEGHGDLTKVGQPVPVYLGDELMGEIKRLREGLALIECEPVNAEYMARNILDGLPAYHDTMMECEAGCKCKTAVPPAPTLHKSIRSAQIAAGEDAVIANLRRMGLVPNAKLCGAEPQAERPNER